MRTGDLLYDPTQLEEYLYHIQRARSHDFYICLIKTLKKRSPSVIHRYSDFEDWVKAKPGDISYVDQTYSQDIRDNPRLGILIDRMLKAKTAYIKAGGKKLG